MQKSETIGALAAALAKAQAEMDSAKKDATNPYFNSRYADLASCWAAARKPLTANGLAVIQTTGLSEAGVIVETTLAHSSGEWITSDLLMPLVKKDSQGVGSAITYGRRYALAAIVGLVTDDDDGEAAMGRQETGSKGSSAPAQKPTAQAKPATQRPAQQAAKPAQAQKTQTSKDDTSPLLKKVFAKLKGADGLSFNDEQCKKFMEHALDRKIESSKNLSDYELEIILVSIDEAIKDRRGAA